MDVRELATFLATFDREWEKLPPVKPGLYYYMAQRLIEEGIVQ